MTITSDRKATYFVPQLDLDLFLKVRDWEKWQRHVGDLIHPPSPSPASALRLSTRSNLNPSSIFLFTVLFDGVRLHHKYKVCFQLG